MKVLEQGVDKLKNREWKKAFCTLFDVTKKYLQKLERDVAGIGVAVDAGAGEDLVLVDNDEADADADAEERDNGEDAEV